MKTNKLIIKQHLKLYLSTENSIFKQQILAGTYICMYMCIIHLIHLALSQNNKVLNIIYMY